METKALSRSQVLSIRNRWSNEVTEEINRSLSNDGDARSPFGEYNGRQDLRGIRLNRALARETVARSTRPPRALNDIPALAHLDFSFGVFEGEGQLSDVHVVDCRFDKFGQGSNWRSKFQACTFVGANMKRSQLLGEFVECDFESAKLSSSRAARATRFVRCNFRLADLRDAIWTQVLFEDCTFDEAVFGGGSLGGAKFLGCAPARAQLGDTLIGNAMFPNG
jgi:uncharacterized protein YjbI with pentapeptide repeats